MSRTSEIPKLTKDGLVDAAMAIADRDGIEALTIRRLARELGVSAMAIYWHVDGKPEVLEALGERMFAEVHLPERSDAAWHVELGETLQEVLSSLRTHPAVAALALPTILTSEAGLEIADRILALLEEAGFEDRAITDIGVYLLSSIVTLVGAEPGAMRSYDEDGTLAADLARKQAMIEAVPAQRFPSVARLRGALLVCDPDEYFARGLDMLMLGVRGLIEA